VSWSPYYKVTTSEQGTGIDRRISVSVNGIPHQIIAPLERKLVRGEYYVIPYRRIAEWPRRVLVIGAGDGTDVTLALKHRARRVDAVEIDPKLLELGRTRNVDRPYSDPRVHTYVTDGRAFLERTNRRYDLIVFALPDSLTLVASQSSLRLESYLFTREAFETARRHLRPHGAFAMYNFYRRQWLVDRFAGMLEQVYGHAPCIDEQFGQGPVLGPVADLVVARDRGDMRCRTVWHRGPAVVAAATDDHPFPYLRSPGLPGFYVLTLGLILAAALVGVRAAGVRAGAVRAMVTA
jgi:hypothetical protein